MLSGEMCPSARFCANERIKGETSDRKVPRIHLEQRRNIQRSMRTEKRAFILVKII